MHFSTELNCTKITAAVMYNLALHPVDLLGASACEQVKVFLENRLGLEHLEKIQGIQEIPANEVRLSTRNIKLLTGKQKS